MISSTTTMTTIFLIRHAESVANVSNILAGRIDYALTEAGKQHATALAKEFAQVHPISMIFCSPLLRAQQTAAPFLIASDAPLQLDERLQEQHMGRFSGRSYQDIDSDPGYCADRTARWNWVPEGGGESYQMIAERVESFLSDLRQLCSHEKLEQVLIVTHAVTLRLFRACLEDTLPSYPERIAVNGEVWCTRLTTAGVPTKIETDVLTNRAGKHRA
jgi:broad specificity phosphatase PhoE